MIFRVSGTSVFYQFIEIRIQGFGMVIDDLPLPVVNFLNAIGYPVEPFK